MDRIELQKAITEHSSFTPMLYELIKSLLVTLNIKYHTIEYRTKTIESLEEKIGRKNIRDIKEEVMDISGIRIILYYQEDVDKVVDLVKSNFTIDEKNSINKANIYNSNEFGYLSVHYIVTLSNERNKLPEWQTFSKLKAEIQIRTVLQHSWASISHELTYKKNYEIPKELERKLYRLAGLFELADEQFLNIKKEHNLLIEQLKIKEIENSEINLLTLKYCFEREYSISNTIEVIALKAGFINGYSSQEEDNLSFSHMALISNILGYKFIKEIEENLRLKMEDLKLYFTELIKSIEDSFSDSKNHWSGSKSFYLELAMLFLLSIEQLNEFSERSGWNNLYFEKVEKTIKRMKSSRF